MRRMLASLAICPIAALAGDPLLFVYFREPANMGVFFAVSGDGYRWKELNGGKPWVGIEHAKELMRDPFVARGPDGEIHMVWTWGWRGTSLGYAHSRDLAHWSGQREIPIMAGTPGTLNVWAPEIYWDEGEKEWLLIWSSVVPERHDGNRLYCSTTRDFQEFSPPRIFFDTGYMVIDATLLRLGGKHYMVFKDERFQPLKKCLKVAEGPTIRGPWRVLGEEFTPPWSEGPSAVDTGEGVLVYYDHYRPPLRYQAAYSRDMRTWEDLTDRMAFPAKCKHGSFLRITEQEKRRLDSAR